ncbi:MAG: MBL fold metallo-hydrolase [Proteobacteria bacterium]|nr:MBL fold metallo-hydrolase [Pseudomonadota bacterium]
MLKAAVIPVTPFQQNCSLLWCTETMRAAVVDPGGDLDRIDAAIAEQGVTLEKILITHGHLDHAGCAGAFAERHKVAIEGPQKEDIFWIAQATESGRQYGLPDAAPFTPDRWLDDGDTVTVGNLTRQVLHCPGHTPGHVVFYEPESNVAIVGDVLFQGSIGRTDFPRGNHADLIHAITTKLWPLGNDVTFVPGHGPLSTFGEERQSNPFVGDAVLAQSDAV